MEGMDDLLDESDCSFMSTISFSDSSSSEFPSMPTSPSSLSSSHSFVSTSSDDNNEEQGMALSVALPLSGLDTKSFSSFNVFGIKEILDISQSSPTPSVSSDSSGLGSLSSIPASPDDNDKALFAEKTPVPDVKIMYRGRDILDLRSNVDPAGWNFQYAHLPPNNPALFFANRSQYHRLTYPQVDFETETCNFCEFQIIKSE